MIILIIFFASTAYAELKLDSVYPTLGELGQDLEVILTGSGFDMNTRVSMYLDSGNQRAIIGSVATPARALSVTVVGTTAYVADRDEWPSGDRCQQSCQPADHRLRGYAGISF